MATQREPGGQKPSGRDATGSREDTSSAAEESTIDHGGRTRAEDPIGGGVPVAERSRGHSVQRGE